MMNMKKKKIIAGGIVGLLFVLIMPLVMDWAIIGNAFPSNISNENWVSFLGAYLGAIIGALVSLIGLYFTIQFTNQENEKRFGFEKEQNKLEREAQVRPYCDISFSYHQKVKRHLARTAIAFEPQENNGPRYDCFVNIKNIGLGPAVEFKITIDQIDNGRNLYPVLFQQTPDYENNSAIHLQPGDEAYIWIAFWFNFDPIKPEELIPLHNPDFPDMCVLKREAQEKYKDFEVVLHIRYHDLYGNTYYQKIVLRSNTGLHVINEKQAERTCSIYMKETTLPQRE